MYDAHLQTRIVKSCADAFFGYTSAATAAYFNAVGQASDTWLDNMQRATGTASEQPYRSTPDFFANPVQQLSFWGETPSPWAFMAPWMSARPAAAMMPTADPVTSWFNLMSLTPWSTSPTVWPMAFVMMSYGVPREVALPTAEANAAALDAVQAAASSIDNAFSNYRSEGGHASAQLRVLERFAAALIMAPMGFASMPPWLFSQRPF